MANINQIQVGSTVYDIEDQTARNSISNLADVASSGDYGDLDNTPTIPSVTTYTATIAVEDWSNNTCTKAVVGVTASNTIIVSPAYESIEAYGGAGIKASAQAVDSLTFVCDETPTSSVNVNIVVLG